MTQRKSPLKPKSEKAAPRSFERDVLSAVGATDLAPSQMATIEQADEATQDIAASARALLQPGGARARERQLIREATVQEEARQAVQQKAGAKRAVPRKRVAPEPEEPEDSYALSELEARLREEEEYQNAPVEDLLAEWAAETDESDEDESAPWEMSYADDDEDGDEE